MRGWGGTAALNLSLCSRWRWCVNFTPPVLFTAGEKSSVNVEWEAGWASEPVWTFRRRENLLTLYGIEPPSMDV